MIGAIIAAGRNMDPPVSAAELARRVQLAPVTLSRMKTSGRGDIAVIADMAKIVGLRLALAPDDAVLAKLQSGSFFDD
ncbi:MAG: hypothetical protein ACLGHA_09910 [Gammaproteobacteria bacterium]